MIKYKTDIFELLKSKGYNQTRLQKENLLLLEIKNPIETMPKFIDGIPIPDKKGHGIGTKSIVYYVQQLNGQCHFSVEEHCFVLKIILSRCI